MITGSKEYYLSDSKINEIVNLYENGCEKCFGRKPKIQAPVYRMIQGFSAEYGEEAPGIVSAAYDYPYNGFFRGKMIQSNLFSSKFRWLAEEIANSVSLRKSVPLVLKKFV